MISIIELRRIAAARLKDAEILFQGGRYDGAVYLCGYAVEITLKARICRTLKWNEFPSSRAEFQDVQTLKTHKLDVLLRLSGSERKIQGSFLADWSIVAAWDSEARYSVIGNVSKSDALKMIDSARTVIKGLG